MKKLGLLKVEQYAFDRFSCDEEEITDCYLSIKTAPNLDLTSNLELRVKTKHFKLRTMLNFDFNLFALFTKDLPDSLILHMGSVWERYFDAELPTRDILFNATKASSLTLVVKDKILKDEKSSHWFVEEADCLKLSCYFSLSVAEQVSINLLREPLAHTLIDALEKRIEQRGKMDS